ncbi:TIGR01777 family protein [bacterium]|nr:MAG: TIGR01777 family protein [bacterium]
MATVVVAGATGFIGKRLCELLKEEGWTVLRLVREGQPGDLVWDGSSAGDWEEGMDGADAVINLAGAPITLSWTDENRKLIRDSRTQSAEALARAILKASSPPKVWVNSSAIGFYGDRGDELVTEDTAAGTGFLSEICVAWEEAAERWELPATRLVLMRTGVVLGKGGGAFEPLLGLAKAFLGGAAGDGRQWMPWISLEDLCRMYVFALDEERVNGPINGVAPEPARNVELMASLRKALGRPWAPSAPEFALNLASKVGGPDPSMLLDSMRVVPRRAKSLGFTWKDKDLDVLLVSLVA